MATKTLERPSTKPATEQPQQEPSPEYIKQGINDIEAFANQNASTPPPKEGTRASDQTEKEAHARRDAKAVTGSLTGAKWGGRLGGKYGRIAGAGAGAAFGGHRGTKEARKKGEKKDEQEGEGGGKHKKVTRTRLLAKEALKAFIDYQLKKLAWANAADTFGLSVVAYYAVKHWKVTITLIIAIFLVLFTIFDTQIWDAPQDNTPTTSESCNPASFTNQDAFGKTSVCTISVTYNGSAQDITITDSLLPGTDFVSADHSGTYDKTSDTVTWDAQKLNLPLNPVNITISVTVRITTHQNNTTVYNAYSINPVGLSSADGSGGGVAGQNYVAPNTDSCSGKYSADIAKNYLLMKNFGDPQCNISKDQAFTMLKQQDSQDASQFFTIIIPCESSWDPNTWASPATGTPNGQGAWGLFQMGDSRPPGQPASAGSIQDRGDVNWPLQIVSATKTAIAAGHVLNNSVDPNKGYWSGLDWSKHASGGC